MFNNPFILIRSCLAGNPSKKMLIEIKIKNFRSIKEAQTFSMVQSSTPRKNIHSDHLTSDEDNIYKLNLLKSSIIYGANASGKSNLLKAIMVFEYLVKKSIDFKFDSEIPPYEPFLLSNETRNAPVELSVEFIAKDNFRYIYEIGFTQKKIVHESLHFFPKFHKALLFKRSESNDFVFGKTYFNNVSRNYSVYENQLFLSKVGVEPIEELKQAYLFFTKYLYCHIVHDTDYDNALLQVFTDIIAKDDNTTLKENISKLLKAADTGISGIKTSEIDQDKFILPKELSEEEKKEIIERYKYRINTIHHTFEDGRKSEEVLFDYKIESTGTKRLLTVGALILEALEDGTVLVVDELDKSLHPFLTRMLIELFHSKKNNPHNAQLLMSTHDVSFIDYEFLRLDQIWITEKDSLGATDIYSMSDFKQVEKTRLLDWYFHGRFGGIPNVSPISLW